MSDPVLIARYALMVCLLFAPYLGRGSEEALLEAEPFAAPSGGRLSGLMRLTMEESGLRARSEYRDPRAWGERLRPATIGTVGTGIGVGDFDGDGYPDLFVAMREGRNRLYLNNGGNGFVDATERAGILESPDWTSGVTVVDVNGDGLSDIYVCFFDAPNRLYLNRGDAVFEEVANELGLAIRDASSGAFFADYDKDGDLDLYLQTNVDADPGSAGRPDYFLRNDGADGFVDATRQVGLRYGKEGETFGHSALWIDYDGDGWEDLYVANDFREPDTLYLNSGDGAFRDESELLPVAPYSSMGSDLGDVNGDGLLDLLATDMATPSYRKHVESMLTSAVKVRELPEASRPTQTMKNALLINRGSGDFVDVAYAWNLAATDWTWAARLIDLDNDGLQDAVFTNGMIRQFHNADLALEQDRQKSVAAKTAVFARSPVLEEENLVFRNLGGGGFEPANERWGFSHRGVSFGLAALDFDRDGDLDFVYTNYEGEPTLWRNDLGRGNAVQVRLVGSGKNRDAIGAVAIASFQGQTQAAKILSNRGYLGSDEKLLHFGLGDAKRIQALEIIWPDGARQEVRDLEAGRRYAIRQVADGPLTDPGPSLSRFVWQGEVEAGPSPTRNVARGEGLLYPFKALPTPAKSRLLRADFDGDEKSDSLILRDWEAPRLLLSGSGSLSDASESWSLADLAGVWETALVEDFTDDGRPDVFLGGLGTNNEISYRSAEEGRMIRRLGRFRPDGPLLNLNAYDWGGTLRLYDGLRDYSEIEASILKSITSFRDSGELDAEDFMELTGFQTEKRFEIDRFRSGVLVNLPSGGFRFEPLPLEGQYGRVWDAAAGDVNGDGVIDLVLLLGEVSPHFRSTQDEGSFVSVLLGKGDGAFVADKVTPLDRKPDARMIGLSLKSEYGKIVLELLSENGVLTRYAAGGDVYP